MDFIEWREYDVDEDDIDVRKSYEEANVSKSPRRLLIKTLIVLGGIAAVAVVLITVH